MATEARSTKLKFKGEKSKKKRTRDYDSNDPAEGSSGGSKKRKQRADEYESETWVLPEEVTELRGPTFIVQPADPSPISINFNSTSNRIVIHSLDKDKPPPSNGDGDDDDSERKPIALLDRTPADIAQVWVITRVAGSATINIRTGTGDGKFLSCDKHGIVSADRDARGPQEEWTPVLLPDGMVAFMNVYEKYLSVDEVAGGSLQLRGDSEEVGFAERFWVKIQYKYKKEAHEEQKKKTEGMNVMNKVDEAATNKIYQAWGAGRTVTSAEDKKALKKAKKEGRLAEALLDRRSKLKSDRFC